MQTEARDITPLVGEEGKRRFDALCERIETLYEMEALWTDGGKAWDCIYKYRRGGKTLCALCVRKGCLGVLIVLGKAEREKFDAQRDAFSLPVQSTYDETKTYHDGKWLVLKIEDDKLFEDVERLLRIKRRPNLRTQ